MRTPRYVCAPLGAGARHNGEVSSFRAPRRLARAGSALARPRLAMATLALLCAMLLGAMLLPVPYVIERPGPAIDVLGEYEGEKILQIEGRETYPTDGALMMTTVAVDGGPGYTVTPLEVIGAWLDRSQAVMPREVVFPAQQTKDETTLQTSVQMSTSQQGAVAVALEELGIPYTDAVLIAGVETGAPADGLLEAGDELLTVNGSAAADPAGFQALTAATPAGQDVRLTVRRDGAEQEIAVTPEMRDGVPRLGIVLATGHVFPFEVHLAVGEVGGPSAGTMFALSVYDELTPGALTGGAEIAGTGTIDEDGAVGPIGGIRQKMVGAREKGAEYFLAPGGNCEQVVGRIPDGLQVVRVDTFEGALHAVETIGEGGDVSALPTCG